MVPSLGAHAPVTDTVDALVDVLSREQRLLDELMAIMRRQREAVAEDDLGKLDDSVFATHRMLVTLGEARRRRRSLCRMLGESDDLSIHDLDGVLGGRMTQALREARDRLAAAAQQLSREVGINRTVLREALASGVDVVRSLMPAEVRTGYGADAAPPERASGGLLIDRTA